MFSKAIHLLLWRFRFKLDVMSRWGCEVLLCKLPVLPVILIGSGSEKFHWIFIFFTGTSDPYVKFKIGNKQYYKSRTVYKNLNPKWDEKFTIPIEDVFKPVSVKCYDYDRGVSDDRMGAAEIDLSMLNLNR